MNDKVPDPSVVTDEGLIRVIGTRELGVSIINMIIGAGIFALPGVVAALLGPAAIFAYLLCSVAVALVFLCFAEAGSRVSRSGGAYAYIETAFGPFAGFVASILLWFGWGILATAAVSIILVDMLSLAFPWLSDPIPKTVFIILLFSSFAAINVIGVRGGVKVAVANTYIKLVPLVALVVLGVFSIQPENLAIQTWPSLSSFGAGTLLLVFAFGGAEIALNTSGEVSDPSRTVPRGLLLGIGVVFILYASLQGVAQGVLGADLAINLEAPLIATAERAFGPWGRTLMIVGAGLSMFGVLSGHVLANPRALFAAARDGLLPSALAKVHPRYNTPYVAIIVYTILSIGFALSGTFKTLAVVSSGSVLVIYLGVGLAVLKLRRQNVRTEGRVFLLPGGPLIPILAVAVVGWLLSNMTQAEFLGLAGLIGVSILGYFVMRVVSKSGA